MKFRRKSFKERKKSESKKKNRKTEQKSEGKYFQIENKNYMNKKNEINSILIQIYFHNKPISKNIFSFVWLYSMQTLVI